MSILGNVADKKVFAAVVELVDTYVSGAYEGDLMRVQISPAAPAFLNNFIEAGTALTSSDLDNAGAVLTSSLILLRKVSAAF